MSGSGVAKKKKVCLSAPGHGECRNNRWASGGSGNASKLSHEHLLQLVDVTEEATEDRVRWKQMIHRVNCVVEEKEEVHTCTYYTCFQHLPRYVVVNSRLIIIIHKRAITQPHNELFAGLCYGFTINHHCFTCKKIK